MICKLTITTTDDALAARLEPGAPSPSRRLAALRELADRGLFAGVLLMPVLPFLEDTEENVLEVVERAAEAGASFVYPALGVTMREGQREYFLQGLEDAFPGQGLRPATSGGTGTGIGAPAPGPDGCGRCSLTGAVSWACGTVWSRSSPQPPGTMGTGS